ncbi:hypothetical protein GWI33_004328 [Rhynchophorus ferrugineus]|uniref:Uncharacterized protein n=1 Tax=Rhynchophorus ferrugineus TaxID=354439 RepID=A0A834IWL7_RHYFE|nr:hypothetical protein GWI33_004328 [Rhynchophorus ferrugineus]
MVSRSSTFHLERKPIGLSRCSGGEHLAKSAHGFVFYRFYFLFCASLPTPSLRHRVHRTRTRFDGQKDVGIGPTSKSPGPERSSCQRIGYACGMGTWGTDWA